MTIKDLADELGVSKDKVRYQVRKLPKDYCVIVGNITYINPVGVAEIKRLLVGKSAEIYPAEITHFLHTLEKLTESINNNTVAVTKLIEQQQKSLPEPKKTEERKRSNKIFDKNFVAILIIGAVICAFCIWCVVNFGI